MTDNPEVILSKSGKAIHVLHISIRQGITTVFISFRTETVKYYTKVPLTLQNCEQQRWSIQKGEEHRIQQVQDTKTQSYTKRQNNQYWRHENLKI